MEWMGEAFLWGLVLVGLAVMAVSEWKRKRR